MMGSLLLSERQINCEISSNYFVAFLEKLNCKPLKPSHTLGFKSLYQDQWSMLDIQWLNSDASRERLHNVSFDWFLSSLEWIINL